MDRNTHNYPIRFVFSQRLRISQFIRAVIVIGIGGLIFGVGLSQIHLNPWKNIVMALGGFVALSGLLAFVFILIATLRHKEQVIEVDTEGLKVTRPDKNGQPHTQALQWGNVASYTKEAGGITGFWDWTPSQSSQTSGDDLIGCLIGIVFNVYFILLELFITGFSWQVKFKLNGKRSISISGFGKPMDDFVDNILPHFLPDKLVQPDVKQGKKKKQDADEPTA